MKQYEVIYFGSDNIVKTKIVEADNAIEARKTVTKEEGTFIKARQLGMHRKAVVYSVAVIEPEEDETPVMKVYHTTLYGVGAESKSVKAKCLADATKKFPNRDVYYIYNIENA